MLAATCQIRAKYPNITCSQKAAGFWLRPDESASAVYKAGVVLCKGHGEAGEGEGRNGFYRTISEVADMVTMEDIKAHKHTQPEDSDMTTTVARPTMDQHNRVDLGQLAAMVNSRTADSRRLAEPRMIAVPRAIEEPTPDVQDLGRVKSQEELEEEDIKRQMAALKAQLDAKKRARIEREKAEAEAAKRAKALEHDASYQFSQAAQLRAYLMLHGGSSTMQAVQTLIEAGVLTVKSGALVVRNGAGTVRAPRESTPDSSEARPAPGKGPEYEAKKAQYKVLRAEGKSLTDIADILAVSPGTVSGWNNRYPVALGQPA